LACRIHDIERFSNSNLNFSERSCCTVLLCSDEGYNTVIEMSAIFDEKINEMMSLIYCKLELLICLHSPMAVTGINKKGVSL